MLSKPLSLSRSPTSKTLYSRRTLQKHFFILRASSKHYWCTLLSARMRRTNQGTPRRLTLDSGLLSHRGVSSPLLLLCQIPRHTWPAPTITTLSSWIETRRASVACDLCPWQSWFPASQTQPNCVRSPRQVIAPCLCAIVGWKSARHAHIFRAVSPQLLKTRHTWSKRE